MSKKILPKSATSFTKQANNSVKDALPFENTKDFEDAKKGFIGTWDEVKVNAENGEQVWSLDDYQFIDDGDAPDSVNPSLWRISQLNMTNGLFKVTERVYQVRGFDMANTTIMEGDTGLIITDTLTSVETARAALELYYEHRPKKPIKAIIYTHSHGDHYGGVAGLVSKEDVASGKVALIGPEGFMEHAVSENIFAGNAMARRAEYMYGSRLSRSELGQVDAGLGKTLSTGHMSLIAPNDTITFDHEKRVVDGIEIEFLMAPNTEAPSEHLMYFPQFKLINIAEDAVHNLHNILTLRGAQIRDAYAWWKDVDKAIRAFGDEYEICIGQHHWPTWGNAEINDMLTHQRDAYKYMHDQTLHFINKGLTLTEVAEAVKFPPSLEEKWYVRGYYGTLNHDVKAIYQFYLGWYDGNPANLYPLPPEEVAEKYVEFMGGIDEVLKKARVCYEAGEYRWVAEVVKHAVFADDKSEEAKELLADALEQLGYQSESASWRNVYLAAANELRNSLPTEVISTVTLDVVEAMPFELILDYLGIRLNGEKAIDKRISMNWKLTDVDEKYHVLLNNSVLTYRDEVEDDNADVTLVTTRDVFNHIFSGVKTFEESFADQSIKITGSSEKFDEFVTLLDEFDPVFNIVTP
ncbi:MBL fold metallo-hydrolase [Listeria sp. FSL L7-1485]|uniref:Linear primary-alkylsulfatase n=1 Tax=Listeria immobilis TaxID=2713502 RepID=A0A7X0X8A9_9LIST|nr:alkyl sulfatase dimerization domain-containing protein [Listeria immobilis]MBC1489402.1 MBL fold metallo-hydrolase [Listeria immobilis]MBC1535103.1 MBL fold metallo-hydrolase [Listeria immobilis]